MRAAVILLLALCAPAFGNLHSTRMVRHGKTYSSPEEQAMRSAIFNANVAKINAHNLKGESWTMAINEFADLTAQEFAIGRIGGYKPRKALRGKKAVRSVAAPLAELDAGSKDDDPKPTPCSSDSVDWSAKGAVTPIKNQGQCGSCWAFSTTGSVEGAEFIAHGDLKSLSEEQLVDCSTNGGNSGCNGGLFDAAYDWIVSNGGICSEASYPYTAGGGQSGACKKTCTPVTKISGHKDVAVNNDPALAASIVAQPTSVAIEADQSSFQFYSGGVLTAACGTNIDHAVLAVGYGKYTDGNCYWKVKNSWGASWGMSGYVLIGRGSQYGAEGQCGILSGPSVPIS